MTNTWSRKDLPVKDGTTFAFYRDGRRSHKIEAKAGGKDVGDFYINLKEWPGSYPDSRNRNLAHTSLHADGKCHIKERRGNEHGKTVLTKTAEWQLSGGRQIELALRMPVLDESMLMSGHGEVDVLIDHEPGMLNTLCFYVMRRDDRSESGPAPMPVLAEIPSGDRLMLVGVSTEDDSAFRKQLTGSLKRIGPLPSDLALPEVFYTTLSAPGWTCVVPTTRALWQQTISQCI